MGEDLEESGGLRSTKKTTGGPNVPIKQKLKFKWGITTRLGISCYVIETKITQHLNGETEMRNWGQANRTVALVRDCQQVIELAPANFQSGRRCQNEDALIMQHRYNNVKTRTPGERHTRSSTNPAVRSWNWNLLKNEQVAGTRFVPCHLHCERNGRHSSGYEHLGSYMYLPCTYAR
jgi:hypothetical protein